MNRQTLSQREKLSRRASPEAALHRSVAAYLRLALKPPVAWTTIPSGGGGKVRGAQLKAMGLQKGWPDIIVMVPEGEYTFVVGIELKSAKGTLSPEQRAMQIAFEAFGGVYHTARSVDMVATHLRAHGVELHARPS